MAMPCLAQYTVSPGNRELAHKFDGAHLFACHEVWRDRDAECEFYEV